MAAHPDNDDPIQSRVGLTMATAIEPVARGLAARGRNGTGATQFGKGCFEIAPDFGDGLMDQAAG